MKAVSRDERRIECDAVREGTHGVVLYDADGEQVGYVPYESLLYVAETRAPVASSSLDSVGYDGDERVLEIEFVHGGVYRYEDVSPDVYEGLMSAGSHGRYFHEHVRGQYRYRRIR